MNPEDVFGTSLLMCFRCDGLCYTTCRCDAMCVLDVMGCVVGVMR
jgi:hypothetical protein